ncbi:hypothetical protein OUZ56_016517 [Daphnia magna]|uniref:Uncharacterized protein n=1 Tax=Daphnia magna TaxID=35525 RepID=A0ABR0AQW5_9CRUS|nr:hypothetical protein OUZ56_016517 [Daphnia magna]
MREAAYEAGLGYERLPHQVLISLKPEAASLFCRQLKRQQLKTEKPAELHLTPASLGKPRPLKPWNRSAHRESMYVDAVQGSNSDFLTLLSVFFLPLLSTVNFQSQSRIFNSLLSPKK